MDGVGCPVELTRLAVILDVGEEVKDPEPVRSGVEEEVVLVVTELDKRGGND